MAGDIPAAELQKIWAEGEECWADQNPCDELDSDGISGGVEKCAEMKEKSEMELDVAPQCCSRSPIDYYSCIYYDPLITTAVFAY